MTSQSTDKIGRPGREGARRARSNPQKPPANTWRHGGAQPTLLAIQHSQATDELHHVEHGEESARTGLLAKPLG